MNEERIDTEIRKQLKKYYPRQIVAGEARIQLLERAERIKIEQQLVNRILPISSKAIKEKQPAPLHEILTNSLAQYLRNSMVNAYNIRISLDL